MKSLLALVLAVLISAHALPSNIQPSSDKEQFIVGGEYARVGEFPWQLSLQYMGHSENGYTEVWTHKCGAILYSSRYALTAAQCLSSGTTYRVVAGLHKLSEPNLATIVDVKSFKKHESYNNGSITYINDIAVVAFASEIRNSEKIKPAVIPSDNNNKFANESCFISGWGKSGLTGTPNTLRKGLLPVITNFGCQTRVGSQANVGVGHICVLDPNEYTSICYNDEGGPLTCKIAGKDIVVGMASWFLLGSGKECTPRQPSVYTRLSEYLDWIKKNTP